MTVSRDHIAGPQRVVLVVQTYFPAIDGSAVLIQHLAEQFAAIGDEVHVITTDALGPAGFRTRRAERTTAPVSEEIRGVRVHRLPTRWWVSSLSRPVQALGARLRLRGAERAADLYLGPVMRGFQATLDEVAPTAVYASSFPYWHMHELAEWGRRRHVPVVLHGAIHPDDRWAFDRASIRASCLRAAGYAANTGFEARYVQELGVPPDRITVVGVGVDVELIEMANASRRLASQSGEASCRLLYFGHLAARKGLDILIAALPTIWERHPSVEIVIAGKTTADTHDLRKAANDCSRGHRLRWLADVAEREKAELFASADMLLYPSRAESFGIVFLEAWAFGLPVISCRAGAIPDVVDDGITGLLTRVGDPVGLADCVSRLIGNPAEARRMGAEGRRRVHEMYTWPAVAQRARHALEDAYARMARS